MPLDFLFPSFAARERICTCCGAGRHSTAQNDCMGTISA